MTLAVSQRVRGVELCLAGKDTAGKDLERALALDAYQSLEAFVQQTWHILEPGTPLEWTWHLSLICRELELVTAGQTRELLICIPPGFCKSMLVSVLWPAWWWLREPHKRLLTVSSDDDLTLRDNRRMREVVESDWYKRLVERVAEIRGIPAWTIERDQNRKECFENTRKGVRQCFSIGGGITGHRGDGLIIDDPHQVRDVIQEPELASKVLQKAWRKVSVILPSRVNDRRKMFRVTIMQRLHPEDVAGRLIKRGKGLRTVILPMHAYALDDPDRHPEDPRAPGELLDPVRVPEERAKEFADELDEAPGQSTAQLEQKPIRAEGGLYKLAWTLNRYDFDPQRASFPRVFITVDTTFKATRASAHVSIQIWGVRGADRYLLGEVYAKLDYVECRQVLRDLNVQWRPTAILVEEKANGPALIRELRDEIPCVIGFNPDGYGDKYLRAQLAAYAWKAGNVHLPEAQWMPSVGDFIAHLLGFPGIGRDRMDSMSQLFLFLREEREQVSDEALTQAMQGLVVSAGGVDWFGG